MKSALLNIWAWFLALAILGPLAIWLILEEWSRPDAWKITRDGDAAGPGQSGGLP